MTVQVVSQPVVGKAFAPGIPIRAVVQKMDTLKIDVTLVDEDKNVVDLTGCTVIVTAKDDEKTVLWEPTITSAANGKFTAVVQPDIAGKYELKAKVTKSNNDEVTFFIGAVVVAYEDESTGETATLQSLTYKLLQLTGTIEASTTVIMEEFVEACDKALTDFDTESSEILTEAQGSIESFQGDSSTALETFQSDSSAVLEDANSALTDFKQEAQLVLTQVVTDSSEAIAEAKETVEQVAADATETLEQAQAAAQSAEESAQEAVDIIEAYPRYAFGRFRIDEGSNLVCEYYGDSGTDSIEINEDGEVIILTGKII